MRDSHLYTQFTYIFIKSQTCHLVKLIDFSLKMLPTYFHKYGKDNVKNRTMMIIEKNSQPPPRTQTPKPPQNLEIMQRCATYTCRCCFTEIFTVSSPHSDAVDVNV